MRTGTSSMRPYRLLTAFIALALGACAPSVTSHTNSVGAAAGASRMESRVYDTHAKSFIDFNTLADRAAQADIVFFGEQHDDPATHRAELALLAGIGAR